MSSRPEPAAEDVGHVLLEPSAKPGALRPAVAAVKPSLDAIDGLRGVGSLCILLYHFLSGFTPETSNVAAYPVYAPELTSVVTLFFVISGFTLTVVYNTGAEPPPALSFLKKRVARLAPVYYFSLLPALPSFYVYTSTPALTAATTLLMAQSLVVPNEGWNMPLWQVSAFAFSYPFFPCVLGWLRTWSTQALARSLWALTVLNVIVVLVAMQLLPLLQLNVGILHRWVPLRLPQFFAGIAAGLVAQRGGVLSGVSVKADAIALALATSALVMCPIAVRLSPMFTSLGFPTWDFYDTLAEYIVTPVHCVWLIALSSPDCSALSRRFLASPPLKFLGDISYCIYCIHAPILYLSAWAVRGRGVSYAALPLVLEPNTGISGSFCFPPWAILPLLVVIVGCASAAHFAVEKPSRKALAGTITAPPRRSAAKRIRSMTAAVSSGDSPAHGSSSSRMRGSVRSAMASSRICCSPCDSSPALPVPGARNG